MTTQLALPPIPTAPLATATLATWEAYWAIAKMHRTQERENEYDAELERHHKTLEAAAARSAAAAEGQAAALAANAAAVAAQANNTGSLVASEHAEMARRRTDWIISVARDIFVDRTTTTTSATGRASAVRDAVADAVALVVAAEVAANPVAPPSPDQP